MSFNLHEPRTEKERRSQRQLWMVTLLTVVVIGVVMICFFVLRQTILGSGPR
jgi:predicted ABC-type sugar transport system permease subunit